MLLMINILQDLQTELEMFFDDLNWTYILIFVFVLYGIKYKEEFDWYNDLFNMNPVLKKFKVWVAGVIIIMIFSIFRYLEGGFTPTYVSQLLRSWIIVIVFNSFLAKKVNIIEKENE